MPAYTPPRRPQRIPAGRWAREWEACRNELASREAPATDWPLLERMILNRIAAADALVAAMAKPWIVGSQGQEVAHPGFVAAARADGVAIALARQLVLTPAARKALAAPAPVEAPADDSLDALDAVDELAPRRARR